MKRFHPILALAAGCLSAITAQAQDQQLATDAKQVISFRVPIHTQADDPDGGEYGTWASGDTYKVSFHGDMTFYPVVADVEGQVSWRTTSIRVGTHEMIGHGDVLRHNSDWRFEYRYGQVTEAYDVRPEGVEQTFVLASIPATGDLVVRGRIESKLKATEMSAGHGAITFRTAGGQAIVEYGAATVVDALGHTLQITTQVTGNDVELRVPAAWLAQATAPVTVDPIISTQVIGTNPGTLIDADIARDAESKQVLTAHTRRFGTETDLFIVLSDDDFRNSTTIFMDMSTRWATTQPSLAFIGGSDKWAMSFTRVFGSTLRSIRYRFHDKGLRTLSTNFSALARPSSRSASRSRIGGTAANTTGTRALLVFESDTLPTSANDTEVWGAFLNSTSGSTSQLFYLSAQGSSAANRQDRSNPNVIPESAGGLSPWIVTWQEFDITKPSGVAKIKICRILPAGIQSAPGILGHPSASLGSIRPSIAGRDGRYLLAFGVTSATGNHTGATAEKVFVQRFDFPASSSTITVKTPQAIRSVSGSKYLVDSVAYDHENRSHWLVSTRQTSPKSIQFADLVGYTGRVVDAMIVTVGSSFKSGVTYNDDTDNFALVHTDLNSKIYGKTVSRWPARTTFFGRSCGTGKVTAIGLPHRGTEFFKLRLSGVASRTNAFLSLSLPSQAPFVIPLDAIGMTGCWLNTHPSLALTTLPFTTGSVSGDVTIKIPAQIFGDIDAQMIYLNPGANALGVQATKGIKIAIR